MMTKKPQPKKNIEVKSCQSPVIEGNKVYMNLWQRISAVRGRIQTLKKDKEVGDASTAWGYMVVTHDAVKAVLRPLMAEFGLVDYVTLDRMELVNTGMVQGKQNRPVVSHQGTYTYHIRNADDPDDRHIIPNILGYGEDSGDKGPGKSSTYALKTGQKVLFQFDSGDDEEGRPGEGDNTRPKGEIPLTPEHLDEVLAKADELFGDDADEKLESMCDKIFNVPSTPEIPDQYFQNALNALQKNAERLGKVEPARPSDDAEPGPEMPDLGGEEPL